MSLVELKQAVEELSADERLELAAYLRWRSQKDDPEWHVICHRRPAGVKSGLGYEDPHKCGTPTTEGEDHSNCENSIRSSEFRIYAV
jgi:hypothetical protein